MKYMGADSRSYFNDGALRFHNLVERQAKPVQWLNLPRRHVRGVGYEFMPMDLKRLQYRCIKP
jgi:hypothetical protein